MIKIDDMKKVIIEQTLKLLKLTHEEEEEFSGNIGDVPILETLLNYVFKPAKCFISMK